ncbi:F0F1 ATP synthase subunit B [Buchnera aphidicola (Mollitrichosiphum nigrofasciatum)]|uniref:F0F1 ATP synthase subunit B n=1 Tax=Buchnera aphidicola TaxID=9 RepID=UPI0031B8B32E
MNLNATILGQIISFIFFVWFCMQYIWPPILLNIENRKKKIKKSLKNIKQIKKKMYNTQQKIFKKKRKAKKYIKNIIKQTYKERILILEQTMHEINTLKKENIKKTNIEIKIIKKNIRQKLLLEMKKLIILMTEKIIKKSFNINKHNQLINKLLINFKD